jgi:hypothetical protein
MMIDSKPRTLRNDLLPELTLQTLAISDLKMPKNMARKLDPGQYQGVANGIQAMGFSAPVLVGKGNMITPARAASRRRKSLG